MNGAVMPPAGWTPGAPSTATATPMAKQGWPTKSPQNETRVVQREVITTPRPKVQAKEKNGILVRLSSRVQDFDDRLESKGIQLHDFVAQASSSTKKERSIRVSDSEEDRGRASGRHGRSMGRPSPSPSESVVRQEMRHPDAILHLRNFLESGSWNCCILEHYSGTASSSRRERLSFGRHAAWQRLRSASGMQDVTARGWVCGHHEHGTLVRLIAVEVPQNEGDEKPGGLSGESPLPLLPPVEGEGLLGLLEKESNGDVLSLGTPLRVCFLNDTPMQRRSLREVGACCRVAIEPRNREEERPVHLRVMGKLGPGREEEWPEGGIAEVLCHDPCQSAAAAQARSSGGPPALEQAKQLGIDNYHGSLVLGTAGSTVGHEGGGGQSARLSRVQSRCWADQRVRDGLGRARQGDQKAAIERYDAALELCPQHKEGLVGRGAALTNLGKAREALKDFDAALRLDPEDANALKYREIARKRVREADSAEEKRRRTGGPLLVR